MSATELEQILRDLPRVGKLIKDRPYRRVWRFECAGRPLYLKYYPRDGFRNWLRRMFRGNNAWREFDRLRWLQKAKVPAPRAVASLIGFVVEGRKGDAVILEGLEPAVPLDRYLSEYELKGEEPPEHRKLAGQLTDLLEKLGRGGLGHSDLHLGNIIIRDGELYLLDAAAVHRRGLRLDDILFLELGARPYATRTDLYRAWKRLMPGTRMPKVNRRGPDVFKERMGRVFFEDRLFGCLDIGGWTGHFFKQTKFARRWSHASHLHITEQDWQEAWPLLLKQMESDQFEVLKRSPSGDVLAGEIVLGGRPVSVVIKRPRRKHWWRYLTEIGRGARPRRAWSKAWNLVARNVPTAWPLLMMEKRRLGYVTDTVIIFEKIPGRTLAAGEWSRGATEDYHRLLFRAGRLLRQLEETGMFLYDAKAENWMVLEDEKLGPTPMLIDVDGLRRIKVSIGGFNRLLRSLRENPDARFDDADALALARGYRPFATTAELGRMCGISAESTAVLAGRRGMEA